VLIGEVLYDANNINLAMERFERDSSRSPRILSNVAGCLVKEGDYEEALILLREASSANQSYNWLIGNLQEVMGNKDSAIFYYQTLYDSDSIPLDYSLDRISTVNSSDYTQLKELLYRKRRKQWYIRMERL
jgi:tetratricopeptide (TPR) repeat protein